MNNETQENVSIPASKLVDLYESKIRQLEAQHEEEIAKIYKGLAKLLKAHGDKHGDYVMPTAFNCTVLIRRMAERLNVNIGQIWR